MFYRRLRNLQSHASGELPSFGVPSSLPGFGDLSYVGDARKMRKGILVVI